MNGLANSFFNHYLLGVELENGLDQLINRRLPNGYKTAAKVALLGLSISCMMAATACNPLVPAPIGVALGVLFVVPAIKPLCSNLTSHAQGITALSPRQRLQCIGILALGIIAHVSLICLTSPAIPTREYILIHLALSNLTLNACMIASSAEINQHSVDNSREGFQSSEMNIPHLLTDSISKLKQKISGWMTGFSRGFERAIGFERPEDRLAALDLMISQQIVLEKQRLEIVKAKVQKLNDFIDQHEDLKKLIKNEIENNPEYIKEHPRKKEELDLTDDIDLCFNLAQKVSDLQYYLDQMKLLIEYSPTILACFKKCFQQQNEAMGHAQISLHRKTIEFPVDLTPLLEDR